MFLDIYICIHIELIVHNYRVQYSQGITRELIYLGQYVQKTWLLIELRCSHVYLMFIIMYWC